MDLNIDNEGTAESFSEALFTYLWFTENLISGTTAAETVGDMSDFIAEVAKAVVVLSALTVPSFNESMEEYFKKHDMSRRSVFTFLTTYCFDNHAENEDIFAVVLNTCTFVYRLVIFCQHRGHVEYIEFASMCWSEIFEMDLKDDFYAKGGWEEFRMYVSENRYVPKDKDTDHKAFINFLEEINYLFPKLNISEHDEYMNCISSTGACGPIGGYAIKSIAALPPELLSSEFCQSSNFNVYALDDDNISNGNETNNSKLGLGRHSNELDQDSSNDSDEELFQELVKTSLSSISRISSAPPSEECVLCKTETIVEDRTDIKCHDQGCCPKHNPDYFYYMVTNSDADDSDDNLLLSF